MNSLIISTNFMFLAHLDKMYTKRVDKNKTQLRSNDYLSPKKKSL